MANPETVQYRTGLAEVSSLIGWKRKIGGRYGVSVNLPSGCYSDDTQLRLSVSRAIGHDGYFDVDSFAHIELPVWMSYQLGGGVGTNLAAKNLSKRSVGWANNFFKSKDSSYVKGGGNGAAMRIQPHVWGHPASSKSSGLIKNILVDTICTHGHPKAILGALFHGYCLYFSMIEGSAPTPTSWFKFLADFRQVPSIIRDDSMLGLAWLPTWEEQAHTSFEKAWEQAIEEMRGDIAKIEQHLSSRGPRTYFNIVGELGCFLPQWRGTGTKTALLASALVLIAEGRPKLCSQYAANALNSDTDTIGTMASAIAGSLSEFPPSEQVLDSDYIAQESKKLADIRFAKQAKIFVYPSINAWKPPVSNADSVYLKDNRLYMAGLGPIETKNVPVVDAQNGFCWEWVCTSFGQTLLVKRRVVPQNGVPLFGIYKDIDKLCTPETVAAVPVKRTNEIPAKSLEELKEMVTRGAFTPESIGRAILEASNGEFRTERAMALAAFVAEFIGRKQR
ncbi:MAG: ADP-ribosylglycohydrolase family protein [Desulfovibrio sp.]|nr:ADP-ribosylglycohydrolase family protein [Desulfovibrio sp.]